MVRTLSAVALVLALAAPARAEIQKAGPEVFPGKFQVGAHIIGGQFGFNGGEASGYRLDVDFAGRVKEFEKFSLWVGGGIHYTAGGIGVCGGCGTFQSNFGLWGFVEFSFEKLMDKIPLVPYVRAGPDFGLLYYGGAAGGYVALRAEAGIHYWLTKNIGLGGEAGFSFGGGFYPAIANGFYGEIDFLLGARFAF